VSSGISAILPSFVGKFYVQIGKNPAAQVALSPGILLTSTIYQGLNKHRTLGASIQPKLHVGLWQSI